MVSHLRRVFLCQVEPWCCLKSYKGKEEQFMNVLHRAGLSNTLPIQKLKKYENQRDHPMRQFANQRNYLPRHSSEFSLCLSRALAFNASPEQYIIMQAISHKCKGSNLIWIVFFARNICRKPHLMCAAILFVLKMTQWTARLLAGNNPTVLWRSLNELYFFLMNNTFVCLDKHALTKHGVQKIYFSKQKSFCVKINK